MWGVEDFIRQKEKALKTGHAAKVHDLSYESYDNYAHPEAVKAHVGAGGSNGDAGVFAGGDSGKSQKAAPGLGSKVSEAGHGARTAHLGLTPEVQEEFFKGMLEAREKYNMSMIALFTELKNIVDVRRDTTGLHYIRLWTKEAEEARKRVIHNWANEAARLMTDGGTDESRLWKGEKVSMRSMLAMALSERSAEEKAPVLRFDSAALPGRKAAHVELVLSDDTDEGIKKAVDAGIKKANDARHRLRKRRPGTMGAVVRPPWAVQHHGSGVLPDKTTAIPWAKGETIRTPYRHSACGRVFRAGAPHLYMVMGERANRPDRMRRHERMHRRDRRCQHDRKHHRDRIASALQRRQIRRHGKAFSLKVVLTCPNGAIRAIKAGEQSAAGVTNLPSDALLRRALKILAKAGGLRASRDAAPTCRRLCRCSRL